MNPFVQPLESRTLLAFSPTSGLLSDPTIVADRQAVQTAFDQLRIDAQDGRSTIRTDQQAVRTELQKLADEKGETAIHDALQPLRDKLRADEKARNKELRGKLQELRTTKRDLLKQVVADLKVWRQARISGDQSAIDAAKKTLDDDKKAAQDALKPIRDDIVAIKDKWRPIITADHDAIQAKLEDLDPALKPLYDKLDSDASALNDKLTADQKTLADATDKLKTDIQAWRDAHKPTTTT
jgi:hypothetical protein